MVLLKELLDSLIDFSKKSLCEQSGIPALGYGATNEIVALDLDEISMLKFNSLVAAKELAETSFSGFLEILNKTYRPYHMDGFSFPTFNKKYYKYKFNADVKFDEGKVVVKSITIN